MPFLDTPAGQRLAYNGFDFPSNTETLDFSGRPRYSSDGRTIMYTVFTLTVRCHLQNIGTDALTRFAVIRLTQPAAGLIYSGRGFSNVRLNLPGGNEDVVWGPRPQIISLKPAGSPNVVELVWTVEFALPTCADGITRTTAANGAVAEFCFGLTFDIDRSGYTKRMFKGHVVIAQTRRDINTRTIDMTADSFRERITPPLLEGFHRESQSFTISEDKNRLDWSVTDVEMPPNAPPVGVIEAEASHRWSSEPGNFLRWTGTISASYEVARGVPVTRAVRAFFAMASDRLNQARRNMRPVKVVGGALVPDRGKPVVFVPVSASVADTQIYGKTTVAIEMSVRATGPDLSQILQNGGLWRPVPGADFGLWRSNMGGILGPRGVRGLTVDPRDDVIADLCRPTPPRAPGRTPQPTNVPIAIRVPLQILEILDTLKAFEGIEGPLAPPKPEASFLEYVATLRTETDSGVIASTALPPSPLFRSNRSPSGWDALGSTLPTTQRDSSPVPEAANISPPTDGATVAQQRVAPECYVYLSGFACRALFPIPQPKLLSIGGKRLVPANRLDKGEGFEHQIVGNVLYPVYGARWNLRYLITDMPAGPLPVPPNELQGSA